MKTLREIPGQEFGAPKPRVIYVGLRWNDDRVRGPRQAKMQRTVSVRLGRLRRHRIRVHPDDIRIYNLTRPEWGRGMELRPEELPRVARRLRSIVDCARRSRSLTRIIVGGVSGPMPMAALALKMMLPRHRIELRNHHVSRGRHGPLELRGVVKL